MTAAGRGLGRDVALGHAAESYIVFGTAISAVEVNDVKEASGGRVCLSVCDITKEQAVQDWAASVSDALGGGGSGRIVQISTWTASLPLPFNGPSGASKAAMEVFATVYRSELKRFGIDVVVALAGNMKTGGPAKPAAARRGNDS